MPDGRARALGAPALAVALGAAAVLMPAGGLPSTVLVLVAAVSVACGLWAAPWVGAAGVLLLLLGVLVVSDGTWVPQLVCAAGPWLAGRAVRARRELVTALAERAGELRAEREAFVRLAVARERARIARELHDIVAHHLAVIVVQAGAGRVATRDEPERARERFGSIAAAGEEALEEMARLVDVLHEEGGARSGEDRLRRVLDGARGAGLRVRATGLPRPGELPPEIEAVAHRVLQEGVTNALKHAPGAPVHVELHPRGGELEVEVRDEGAPPSALAATGSGLGLAGLRERVAAAAGTLEAGPDPRGGWRLRVRLPLTHRR